MRRLLGIALVIAMIAAGTLGMVADASAAAKDDKTLTMITAAIARHFNGAVQSGLATATVSTKVFASPLRIDENWNIKPYLATSWETSADGLTVTLKLRDGVKFHDGKPVTSEDVAFTIMTSQKNHPFKTMFAPVTKVDAPDPLTVVIHLSKPHPAILLALTPPLCPVLPKHIYGDGQDPKSHPMNLKPVGCGPYKFVEYKTQEYIILERNQDFFIKGRPQFDTMIIRYIKDSNNRIMVMQRGEADLCFGENSVQNAVRLKKSDHLAITTDGYGAIGPLEWLAFNLRREPLNNPKVRKAIAYAVDRDFIVKKLFYGMTAPAFGPIVPGSPFECKDVQKYDLDLDKAKALLDEAGYPEKAGGKRFSVTMDWEASGMAHRMVAETIKSQLGKVGIDVVLQATPDFPAWAKRVANWDFDLTIDSVWNWGDPVIGVHRTYASSNIRKAIWSNTQGYHNKTVDSLLEQAGSEIDIEKRKALYNQFGKIVSDELPVYWLCRCAFFTIYDKRLKNVVKSVWGVMAPMDEISFAK